MSETGMAKLFKHGRSQAVRLPKDFRMPGTEVRCVGSVAAYSWNRSMFPMT
jgi:hypothetical protein